MNELGSNSVKILIVDSEHTYVEVIKEHLSAFPTDLNGNGNSNESSCQLKHHTTIENSLAALDKEPFDVIILEINLKDSQGLESVKKIKNHLDQIGKKTPIIIYTNIEDYAIAKKAYKLGIKDFLIKGQAEERELRRAITFATYASHLPVRTGPNLI